MSALGVVSGLPTCRSVLRPKRGARRVALGLQAMTTAPGSDAVTSSSNEKRNSASVRILRYPDGHERRIIYPNVPAPEVDFDAEDSWNSLTQTDEDEFIAWNECGLAGAACVVADPDPLIEELSALQKRYHSPKSVAQLVKDSYQVLSGCPWLLPRPLFVLAQQQAASDQATLYCLATSSHQQQVQDELAMVLKRPVLASALSFSRLRDGVVAFDRAEDAARYATCLEADLAGEIEVMEVDSRQLFLLTGEADAVVVYLPWGEFTPLPHQLAAALREAGGE